MQGYPHRLANPEDSETDEAFAAELLELVRGSDTKQPVGQAQYSPTRRTFCVEVMEQAAKMPESHADLLLSESLRATRYAKAPSLYVSERKVGIVPKLATDAMYDVRGSIVAVGKPKPSRAKPSSGVTSGSLIRSGMSASGTLPARRRSPQRVSVPAASRPQGKPSRAAKAAPGRNRDLSRRPESKMEDTTTLPAPLRTSSREQTNSHSHQPPTRGDLMAASIAASLDDSGHPGGPGPQSPATGVGAGVSGFSTSSVIASPPPPVEALHREAQQVSLQNGGRPIAGRIARLETALPKQHRHRASGAGSTLDMHDTALSGDARTGTDRMTDGERRGTHGGAVRMPASISRAGRQTGFHSPVGRAAASRTRAGTGTGTGTGTGKRSQSRQTVHSEASWMADYEEGIASVASLYEVAATLPASKLPSGVIASTLEMRLRMNDLGGAGTMAEEAKGMRSRRQAGGPTNRIAPNAADAGSSTGPSQWQGTHMRVSTSRGGARSNLPTGVEFVTPEASDLAAPARLKPSIGKHGAAIGKASRFRASDNAPRRSTASSRRSNGPSHPAGSGGGGIRAAATADMTGSYRAELRQKLVAGQGSGVHALLLGEDGPACSVRQSVARERLAAGSGGMLGRSQLAEAALSGSGPGPGSYYKPTDYIKKSFRRPNAVSLPEPSGSAGQRGARRSMLMMAKSANAGSSSGSGVASPMRSSATTSLSRSRTIVSDTRPVSRVGNDASNRPVSRVGNDASNRRMSESASTRPGQTTALSKRAVRGAYKLSRPARPYLPSLGITTEMDGMLREVQGVA